MYAGKVNFASPLFIDLYRIYMYFVLCTLFWWIDKKKERILELIYAWLYSVFACVYIHDLCSKFVWYLWAYIEYLYDLCYAWVKGKLLQSISLIHAYITPWVLSSSKRRKLLAQRPITLVLMMTNSCSYSTNKSCCVYVSDIDQDLNWCLASLKDSKSSLELTHCDSRAQPYSIY